MKLLLITLFMSCLFCARSQWIDLRCGHTLTPADYVSLGYEQPTNTALNFSLRGFLENSHKNNLNYSAYGLDIIAITQTGTDRTFSLRGGIGATVQIENEPWIYKNLTTKQKMNYGLVGELTGEWNMTENFSLSVFGQQKFLFNKSLGTTHFVFGGGLKFNLANF